MSSLDAKHYLLDVSLRRDRVPSFEHYPFHLPAVKYLDRLVLHPAITFNARPLEIEEQGLVETHYQDTQMFRTTRDFLNAPERHLHHLLK